MLKPYVALCTLLTVSCAATPLRCQIRPCADKLALSCDADANTVTENPKNLSLKANSTFTLSSVPASASDVRIFINGVTLIQDKDFSVTGQTVKFLQEFGDDVPSMVRITYQSQFVSSAPQETRGDSRVDLVVRDALVRSATGDYSAGTATAGARSQATNIESPNQSRRGSTELSSLRMLVNGLNSQQDRHSGKLRSQSRSRSSLQGVEGLGETSPLNSYALSLGVTRDNSVDRSINGRDVGVRRNLRSLRLLEQMLDETGGH